MSVTTNASLAIDRARGHIDDAVRAVAELVVNRCSGTEDYADTYIDDLRIMLSQLIEMRDHI